MALRRLSVRGREREMAIGKSYKLTLAEARRCREEHGEGVGFSLGRQCR